MIRTYSELAELDTFEDRYNYLRLGGRVGRDTFGFDRYLNQAFYRSPEWLFVRNKVIARDNGCDLGVEGREIWDRILVHHMNPISKYDIIERNPDLWNPDFLICVSHSTHNAIHYGDDSKLFKMPKNRTPGDTKLW